MEDSFKSKNPRGERERERKVEAVPPFMSEPGKSHGIISPCLLAKWSRRPTQVEKEAQSPPCDEGSGKF